MSRKGSKKLGGCGLTQGGQAGGARSGSSFITEQAKLGAYIAKSLGVKQGPTMVRLITWMRKKGPSGVSAEKSLSAARSYFDSHKEEARKEYMSLDKNKPVRGKSSKKAKKSKEPAKKKSSKKTSKKK